MKLFRWRGRTSKSAFRDRVCTALREKLPGALIEATGDLEVHVSGLANGKSLDVWLGRAYDEFCKEPVEAEEVIARHVRGALVSATDPPVELDRIIPTVKERDWLTQQVANYPSHKGPSRFEPWVEPYNAELAVVYAEYRDGIRYLNRSDFESLGISDEAIRERALDLQTDEKVRRPSAGDQFGWVSRRMWGPETRHNVNYRPPSPAK